MSRLLGGVRAAVYDVHERHGQHLGVYAAQVVVQGQAQEIGRGAGVGHGDAQDGVGAQAALVLGAVQLDHEVVQRGLAKGLHAHHRFGDLALHVFHGAADALAAVAVFFAVSQFKGFAGAGGRARRHRGPAYGPGIQGHFHLDGGIAARVEDFPCPDSSDGAHDGFSLRMFGS